MTRCNIVCSGNAACRAVACAHAAADTFVLVDGEGQKVFTYAGRALLVDHVFNVLIPEVVEGGEDGVG